MRRSRRRSFDSGPSSTAQVSGDARGDDAAGTDGNRRGHERDAVLACEFRPPRDVDREHVAPRGDELALEGVAVGAERVRELHDDLAIPWRGAELAEVITREPTRADPRNACPEPVDLAADAQTGDRREERECGHDETQCPANSGETHRVRERRAPKEHDADNVREARWTAVLDRPFAQAWLDYLEVEDARKAPAAPERQPDRKLRGE